jgi:hypothetical protein
MFARTLGVGGPMKLLLLIALLLLLLLLLMMMMMMVVMLLLLQLLILVLLLLLLLLDTLVRVLLEVVAGGAARRQGRPQEPRVLERILLTGTRVEDSLGLEPRDRLAALAGARRRRLDARGRGRGRQGAVLVAPVTALGRLVVRSAHLRRPLVFTRPVCVTCVPRRVIDIYEHTQNTE